LRGIFTLVVNTSKHRTTLKLKGNQLFRDIVANILGCDSAMTWQWLEKVTMDLFWTNRV
jgi:hypothetical protein